MTTLLMLIMTMTMMMDVIGKISVVCRENNGRNSGALGTELNLRNDQNLKRHLKIKAKERDL